MGRPPCCDKVGIKKGPWTPEEDIILVSYIQEHGPGNWRSVPTNTGLLRCSKSCRLRWTNYLRPGIKRGNFTPHEEGMIIHLQALLGNKWAAIASYLPQRTDNDIKNYWNTHLKKKLKKIQSALDPHNMAPSLDHSSSSRSSNISALDFSARNLTTHNPSSTAPATYASSTENISRLLEGWMRSSPNKNTINNHMISTSSHHEDLDSILSFHNMGWDKSTCDSADTEDEDQLDDHKEAAKAVAPPNSKSSDHNNNNSTTPQLSVLEKWLLDESSGQVVEEMMDLSPSIF